MLDAPPTARIVQPSDDWVAWFSGLNRASWPEDHRLERARAFINAHYQDNIDLDAMARCAFMSRFHFQRCFRRAYRMTPHQYLTQRRIARARALLIETDMSVTDVCMDVGFSSLGSFSTLFRRHVGHSPSRHRASVFAVDWARPPAIPGCFFKAFTTGLSFG